MPDEPTQPSPAPSIAAPAERVGRFEVRRLVGEGGFGRVYEAYDPVLKRVVALKVAKGLEGGRAERFGREARAAGQLMHPNIVAVFDSGTDGGQHYIASAFVEGRSLDDAVAGPMDPRRAAEVGRRLADALAYAHKQG